MNMAKLKLLAESLVSHDPHTISGVNVSPTFLNGQIQYVTTL
jgi:hypothetical protein